MRLKLSNNFVVISILFLFILITYGNIFNNEMLWDDEVFIIENPDIKSFSNAGKFFVYPDFGGLYRPVKSILMTISYKVWGLRPFGYHLNSFVLHFLSTSFVFFIVSKISKKKSLGFFTSVIFAIHPIHTERVTGITAGFDLLGIVFYLCAFFLYIKFRQEGDKKFLFYSVFVFLLSLFSSEEGISFPLAVILYEITFNGDGLKKDIKNRLKLIGGYFGVVFFYLVIRFLVLGKLARESSFIAGNFYSTMLTMSRVIAKYIVLLIFPLNLSLNDTIPFSISILDFRVILSLAVISAVLLFGLRQFSGNKMIFFSIMWFFATLLPFYNVIPISSLFAERYLYLPSFGICLLFSLIFFNIKRRWRAAGIIFIVLLMLFFSVRVIVRNNDWQDAETLWKKTIQTSEGYYGGYNNLGMMYLEGANGEEARGFFEKAIGLKSDYAPAYNNLGKVYLDDGDYQKAFELFNKAIELEPNYPDPYNNLGILYKNIGNYSLALGFYKKSISLKEEYYEAHYNLGILYNELEEYDFAVEEFLKAIEIRPTYAKAHNNLGVSLMNLDDAEGAIAEFERALELDSEYEPARNNLVIANEIDSRQK